MSEYINAIDESGFKTLLENSSSKPALVDFWATWCGPCKAMAPFLEEIAQEHSETLAVAKVDVDEHPELAAGLSIRAMPTLMLLKDGEVAAVTVGAMGKVDLEAFIQPHIS